MIYLVKQTNVMPELAESWSEVEAETAEAAAAAAFSSIAGPLATLVVIPMPAPGGCSDFTCTRTFNEEVTPDG